MITHNTSPNPWPGNQLRSGVIFFWRTAGDADTIFRGTFENYGKEVKVKHGADHPAAYFSAVTSSKDFGKSWQAVESTVYSTKNNFYTNLRAVANVIFS